MKHSKALPACALILLAFLGLQACPNPPDPFTADPPTAIAPADASPASSLQVGLEWSSTTASGHYELELSAFPDFSSKTTIQCPSNGHTLTKSIGDFTDTDGRPTGAQRIYWRVRAIGAAQEVGNYSAVRSFTLNPVVRIEAGGYWTVALMSDGSVYQWGSSSYAGDPSAVQVFSAVSGIVGISCGNGSGIALDTNGKAFVWDLPDPTAITPINPVTPAQIIRIAAGSDSALGSATYSRRHFLCIDDSLNLWAMGSNSAGQLGTGDKADSASLTQLSAGSTSFAEVFAGDDCSFAIDSAGQVWAWGANDAYQLGLGDNVERLTPTQLPAISSAVRVSSRGGQSLFLASKAYAGGDNAYWQGLGGKYYYRGLFSTAIIEPAPLIAVPGPLPWVAAAGAYAAGISGAGAVYAWGVSLEDYSARLATPSFGAPAKVKDSAGGELRGVVQLATGFHRGPLRSGIHAIALTADGRLFGWGDNQFGQISPTRKYLFYAYAIEFATADLF